MTLADLRGRWALRDRRYSLNRHGLTERSVESVREWRMQEVAMLTHAEARLAGVLTVKSWHPPRPKT